MAEGHDVVVLSAEDLMASSLNALQNELRLSRDTANVLENWPGNDSGFLVIDALDAARDAGTSRALRLLISLVLERSDRWRVVASIRKFDLRYSAELQRLFRRIDDAALDPEISEQEFVKLSHLSVPRLSDHELRQAIQQAPALIPLMENASQKLCELLGFPFNLRLAAELLDSGVNLGELHAIETQLQLLDRYWHERVTLNRGQLDSRADARATALRETCSEMVRRRSLKAERARVASRSDSITLDDLLSSQILMEESRGTLLLFAHHVLFDYVAFRSLLPNDSAEFSKQIADDPEHH